jgi:uncharacterized membrane protein YkoI
VVACAAGYCARAAEVDSRSVSLNETPAAVQQQIKTQLGDGKLEDIDRDEENGGVTYTVGLTRKDGEERYFTVAEDGVLLSVQVELKEVPVSISQVVKTQVGAGTLDKIEKTFDEGEISYDVNFTRKDGVERSFTVDAKGVLTSIQIGLEEVPLAARTVIEDHSAMGKPGDVYKLIEDGRITYSVELHKDTKVRELVVTPEGKIETLQKFLDELPGPAQKTVREKAGSGKILRIDKSFARMQGVEPFRVETREDDKLIIFNVGPKGRFLGEED